MIKLLIFILFLKLTCGSNVTEFCLKYNCKLESPTIKCSNVKSNTIDLSLLDLSIRHLDLSNNQIQKLEFNTKSDKLNLLTLNLSRNSISALTESYFAYLPHLDTLDLSYNPIEDFNKNSFNGLTVLNNLNLSQTKFPINDQLCVLKTLKNLDLSYLDLKNLFLECWKTCELTKLNLKNSINSDLSWKNWDPYLPTLKILDLSNSSITSFELWQNSSLTHLMLSNNAQLDKKYLIALINNGKLLNNLKCLVLRNNNLNTSNFPIAQIIKNFNSTLSLEMLDLENNLFTDDLNEFLFDQKNLVNLKYFNGKGNKFKQCNKRLESVFLNNLEYLDLSRNELEKSSCLYSIKNLKSLSYLDLSINYLNTSKNDADLETVFMNSLSLSYINLANNLLDKFVIRLKKEHTRIKLIDFSNNKLTKFRFEPVNLINKTESDYSLYDFEEDNDTDDTVIETVRTSDNDNDERYLFVESMNLGNNNFTSINIYHQFQTVRNILYLNFSHNEVVAINGLSGDPLTIKEFKQETDTMKNIMCVDTMDFSWNKLIKLPNFLHSCISRISFEHNLLGGRQRLIISNYTLYFLDLINLKANDITSLGIGLSGQKFKSDYYTSKNSPIDYFYAHTNKTAANHTYIDLKENPNFECDCKLFQLLSDYSYLNVKVDCRFTNNQLSNCKKDDLDGEKSTKITPTKTQNLNRKLRFLFVFICLILILFSFSLVFIMCTDLFKNFTYVDQVRGILRRKYSDFLNSRNKENSGVQYSKLMEDTAASRSDVNA